jgi:hypothetical protein
VNKKKQKNFPLWFRVRTDSGAPWIERFFFGSFCLQKELLAFTDLMEMSS